MDPGGYVWWYVDALSDDGRHGLTIIAFIGSVFSPYYAWSGRRDPINHCAVNVALYGPRGKAWAMTERGRDAVNRGANALNIGPSTMAWDGSALTIAIDEIAVPVPRRLRGTVRIEPFGINTLYFHLDTARRHIWRPIAPAARVFAQFSHPDIAWRGTGYIDMNAGDEPLEAAFNAWTWSRANLREGAAILYDADRREGGPLSLALRFDKSGAFGPMAPPPRAALPRTGWRVARQTRSDDGAARVTRCFEDTPFYARSLVSARLFGESAESVHESLSLSRFSNPVVRLMLPFRMPRW